MNYKSAYAEKLRDPRWQKKRLRILERDNWKCQCCYSTTSALHVHHLHYTRGKEPWEYEDKSLVVLCEQCHKEEPELLPQVLELYRTHVARFLLADDIRTIAALIMCAEQEGKTRLNVLDAIFAALPPPKKKGTYIHDSLPFVGSWR
jgi:hypothetical protein